MNDDAAAALAAALSTISEDRAADDVGRLRKALALQGYTVARFEDVDELDAKGRGPTYWRGHADGRLAERAEPATTADGGQLRERTARSLGLTGTDAARWSPPPFAPELADAPIRVGPSGTLAPMVVDDPVHDSTLPAELGPGPLRDFPSDRDTDESTHYPGDGCQPPHPDPTTGEHQ